MALETVNPTIATPGFEGDGEAAPANGAATSHPLGKKMFDAREIDRVRNGINGIKGMIPARCYYDEDLYQFEVDHILKKNWLIVGRWDEVAKVGDWITREMFGESVLIVRDKKDQVHAFLNVCRHRWARLVEGTSGNSKLLVCNFHSWTYDLDGSLRGVAVQSLPGLDKSKCKLHELRLEIWQGFIFVNFDPDAAPLAPQLAGLTALFEEYGADQFTSAGGIEYDTQWNYKFTLETGYETYHHEGVHRDLMANTAKDFHPYKFGEIWGTYKSGRTHGTPFPFGRPPWLAEDRAEFPDYYEGNLIAAIYPNAIMVLTPHRVMSIYTEYKGVKANRARTAMAMAPWAEERDPALTQRLREIMTTVAGQDADGCRLIQAGIESRYNRESYIHPLESQLSHYYNWYLDQYLAAGKD